MNGYIAVVQTLLNIAAVKENAAAMDNEALRSASSKKRNYIVKFFLLYPLIFLLPK
jgi:hypothetical protein